MSNCVRNLVRFRKDKTATECEEWEEEWKYLPEPCRSFYQYVEDFAHGKLDGKVAKSYHHHLIGCHRCTELYKETKSDPIFRWSRDMREITASENEQLLANLGKRLQGEDPEIAEIGDEILSKLEVRKVLCEL